MTVLELPLPDAKARDTIAKNLDANILVEAGAGSGKTTVLIDRMKRLIVTGTATAAEIAALTFTRKAAAELRERFQNALEKAARTETTAEARARAELARRTIHEAFVGTIHSFCGRLLRDHSLLVGLDPFFTEMAEGEEKELLRGWWHDFVDRMVCDSDPLLERLLEAGVEPSRLSDAFQKFAENPDVEFPRRAASPPSEEAIARVREELGNLLYEAIRNLPHREPPKGWDTLQKKVRKLLYQRRVVGWGERGRPLSVDERSAFFDALALLRRTGTSGHRIVQSRWNSKAAARQLQAGFDKFSCGASAANELLDAWYEHRYFLAAELASRAASECTAYRLRSARLTYADLLHLAAKLLRENSGIRRRLGLRHRRLLVDEFQDTDPVQAEIVFLLASEPDGDERGPPDWRLAVPRPGGLFVVGDPKQSIYRFRRADIQMYAEVKSRFAHFGEILPMTTNFRSCAPIGDLVNRAFDGLPHGFPKEATEEQAAFASLDTRACPKADHRVGAYGVGEDAKKKPACAEDDAERVASWIAMRTTGPSRVSPGSFMVLTYRRRHLTHYARALERHRIPFRVTGTGATADLELRELRTALECMADPVPVRVVATLTGYFFGLDYLSLVEHRRSVRSREPFDIATAHDDGQGHPKVREALATLRKWWLRSTSEPADVFVAELCAELGLLPHAAASSRGSQRAGGLAYALDAVRARAFGGDASLLGALDAIEGALEAKDAETPLEPGREDVVRVMNLHQAKGLEADIVILADPAEIYSPEPSFHVVRTDCGKASGYLRITESDPERRYHRKILAQPPDWRMHAEREKMFERAERTRLLYVATTRARRELLVAVWDRMRKKEPAWGRLGVVAERVGVRIELEKRPPPPSENLDLGPEEALRRRAEARAAIEQASRSTYRLLTVTGLAKENAGQDQATTAPDGTGLATGGGPGGRRGIAWGRAVHDLLSVAASGVGRGNPGVGTDFLRWSCRRALDEAGMPSPSGFSAEARSVRRTELEKALGAEVAAVIASPFWKRVQAADKVLAEVPFAWPRRDGNGVPEVVRGAVDLSFLEADGWVLCDYKSDDETGDGFRDLLAVYRKQLDLYAEAWEELTGAKVRERVIYLTRSGNLVSWRS